MASDKSGMDPGYEPPHGPELVRIHRGVTAVTIFISVVLLGLLLAVWTGLWDNDPPVVIFLFVLVILTLVEQVTRAMVRLASHVDRLANR